MEYNRQKNVTQDTQISVLSSQVNEILSQRPSGFLPRVYYGLTRGSQTYRFLADAVINISGLSGNIGDAFEFVSQLETSNYIPAVAIMINATQVQINIQGDYNVSTTQFDIINMRTGASITEDLGSVLATQYASYLGDYDPQTNADKQVTVLYDLELNEENVVFASVDFSSDEVYNWVRIGGYSNGVDGQSSWSISSATATTVMGVAKIGDTLISGEDFTFDGVSFVIGGVYELDSISPLAVTPNGNIRGPQGEQGVPGQDGADGAPGETPTIVNGNWYIGGVDTGVQAEGVNGTNGQNGQAFQIQSGLYSTPDNWGQAGNTDSDGNALLQLPTLPQIDISGKGYVVYDPLTTPLEPFYDLYWANNGDNDWTIEHPFSGIKGADGSNGYTPYISGGYWYINGTNTGVPATGPQGNDGATPTIVGGYWYINGTNTGVKAEGVDGQNGTNGTNGTNGVTPDISMTATGLAYGQSPTVAKSGTLENPIFTLGIPEGAPGQGVPSGGTTGQYLKKTSNSDYATSWYSLAGTDIVAALGYTPANSANIPTSINGMSGGTLSSALVLKNEGTSSVNLDQNNAGQLRDASSYTIYGFKSGETTNLYVGASAYALKLRGSGSKPQFNGNDLALDSDIQKLKTNMTDLKDRTSLYSGSVSTGAKTLSDSVDNYRFVFIRWAIDNSSRTGALIPRTIWRNAFNTSAKRFTLSIGNETISLYSSSTTEINIVDVSATSTIEFFGVGLITSLY